MRVLVTGAGGQLGTDLSGHCRHAGDEVTALTRCDLDITDPAAVSAVVDESRPDVIFNAAAWTAVDACEHDEARADVVNGHAVRLLAQAADQVGAHLVQVSTDYVFDGTKDGPYLETDEPNPRSAYGRSKLIGERACGDQATIVRTSWVCSAHGANMVATIARLAGEHETLSFVADQIGRPTFTADLAVALRNLGAERAAGIFHCANHGVVSWHGFAQAVLAALGADPARVHAIATADLDPPRPAPRPANSVLSTSRYDAAFGSLPDFREALRDVIGAYR